MAVLNCTKLPRLIMFRMLGFISMVAQLVLLREFIKTFNGNELVIGIFLAIWMMLTGAGAWADGRRVQHSRDIWLRGHRARGYNGLG